MYAERQCIITKRSPIIRILEGVVVGNVICVKVMSKQLLEKLLVLRKVLLEVLEVQVLVERLILLQSQVRCGTDCIAQLPPNGVTRIVQRTIVVLIRTTGRVLLG